MNTENIIYAKITYKCQPEDAYTGASKGSGIITIDKYTKKVSWTKVRGCNPYWWQIFDAIMKITPPEWYLVTNRIYPYNVIIREGYSGCEYIHLNLYRKLDSQKYVFIKCAAKMEISSTNKIEDFNMYYGDLVEIAGTLYEKRGWEFSRNPRTFKPYKWQISKILIHELVDSDKVFDPEKYQDNYHEETRRRDNPRNKRRFNRYKDIT